MLQASGASAALPSSPPAPPAPPGLGFLREHQARRAQASSAPDFRSASPFPADSSETMDEEESGGGNGANKILRDYERPVSLWRPINALPEKGASLRHGAWLPRRFVDGKDVGRAVAYLMAPEGFALPLRLSQIGAIALRAEQDPGDVSARLCTEGRVTQIVVSLMADLFPWDEIERFAAALALHGVTLLISRPLRDGEDPYNLSWMRENVRSRTREEMFRHERDMLLACADIRTPTITDGGLARKAQPEHKNSPLFGVIKSHADTHLLPPEGRSVFYELKPGERTPLIAYHAAKWGLDMVTWYLRLSDGKGDPEAGTVRIEMMRPFFEQVTQSDFEFVSRLSGWLCRRATRDSRYSRVAVTLEPIRRAEDLLGARFENLERLTERFYRTTAL